MNRIWHHRCYVKISGRRAKIKKKVDRWVVKNRQIMIFVITVKIHC